MRGGNCLSEKYINTTTNLIWKYEKGHEWQTSIYSRIKGIECQISRKQKRGDKNGS